jgi:hypothetical protein
MATLCVAMGRLASQHGIRWVVCMRGVVDVFFLYFFR